MGCRGQGIPHTPSAPRKLDYLIQINSENFSKRLQSLVYITFGIVPVAILLGGPD